jgi:competence protein ComEC
MLVDGGGTSGGATNGYDIGWEVVAPVLLARGVRKIDVLVITHPHDDHIGGLPAVIESVPVGLALDPEIEFSSDAYDVLKESLARRKVEVEQISEGARVNLGRGVYAEVLNPPASRGTPNESDPNNDSVVLKLVDGQVSMLLTADIETETVQRLAESGADIRATILKVPHHGSAGSAVPAFIDAVHPELALISVGENNDYGHPSEEMLGELKRVGAKVLRTDRDGAITVTMRQTEWSAAGFSRRGDGRRVSGKIAAVGATP